MEQTGHWNADQVLDLAALRELLKERFETIDFEQAKSDARPFINDASALDLWSAAFFVSMIDRIKCF